MNNSSQDSPQHSLHLMIVAGEASGDAHAAALVQAIHELREDITFSGLGGPQMKAAGVQIDEDLTRFAVVGFVEVLKHYKEFKWSFKLFLAKVSERKPAAVILVDYPGFNLRLAKALKKMGIKVIYYISPQVWAWKENRVRAIKKDVERMLVLFQFEKIFYWKHGIDVDFVGHPLVDRVKITQDRDQFLHLLHLPPQKITIGLLPGSRQKEVETLLPIMLDTAKILFRQDPRLQFLVMKSPELPRELYERFLTDQHLPIHIINGDFYNGVNACDLCLVASGTATLETALLGKPMIVVYKTSALTYWLARMLIKIPYIGLVNIVAEEKVVPECIQYEATGSNIANQARAIYLNQDKMRLMTAALLKIRPLLGTNGASRRAAEAVLKSI